MISLLFTLKGGAKRMFGSELDYTEAKTAISGFTAIVEKIATMIKNLVASFTKKYTITYDN